VLIIDLCDFAGTVDGKPLWYEPRQVLKKVLRRFDEPGVKPDLAVELEFYLLAAWRGADGAPLAATSWPASKRAKGTAEILGPRSILTCR